MTEGTKGTSPTAAVHAGVGLVAGCALALQVLLSRLLSAAMYYHFSFLAISVSLVGTGAGGLLVYTRPQWFRGDTRSLLARWSIVLAGTLAVVPFVLVRLDYTYEEIDLGFTFVLSVVCLVAALPSLASGIGIALAIQRYSGSVGTVYAADLVGAAVGALVVVPLMWVTDTPTLIVALGLAAAVAAALFTGSWRARTTLVTTGALVVLVALASTTSVLFLPPRFPVDDDLRVSERWTPLSRVIGYDGGDTSDFDFLFYDRIYAPVMRHQRGDELLDWQDLDLGPQSIGYELTGPGRALIIGGGGGRDIFNALSSEQRPVDVIELNEGIRQTVDDVLGDSSGSPYSLPGVNTVIGDGRSVLARSDAEYDQIHISFTDTLSANSAAGFALTENNLYTLEAFEEYLDHLTPDGVLNVSRLYRLVGDEALRATVLTLEALRRHGIEDPERNVVVIRGNDLFNEHYETILARLTPYSDAELDQIRELTEERGQGIAMAPGGPYYAEWADLAEASSPRAFCENYVLDVCPPTDDQPFFFNMKRLADLGEPAASGRPGALQSADPMVILLTTLGILLVLAAVGYVVPLLVTRGGGRPSPGSLAYFALIGLGFIILEVALIQRFVLFLGYPTYALSVVLFALLLFTGAGSFLSGRAPDARRWLSGALAVTIGLIVASAFVLEPVLQDLIDLPFAARVAISVLLLAPFGVAMGMAMPIGLRRLEAVYPSGVPYAWGVNGVASVVGSVFAVAAAITLGFRAATLVAAACYVGALLHARFGRWSDGADAPDPVPPVGSIPDRVEEAMV